MAQPDDFYQAVKGLTELEVLERKKDPNTNYSWGSDLVHTIVTCADEETLNKFTNDIREHVSSRKASLAEERTR